MRQTGGFELRFGKRKGIVAQEGVGLLGEDLAHAVVKIYVGQEGGAAGDVEFRVFSFREALDGNGVAEVVGGERSHASRNVGVPVNVEAGAEVQPGTRGQQVPEDAQGIIAGAPDRHLRIEEPGVVAYFQRAVRCDCGIHELQIAVRHHGQIVVGVNVENAVRQRDIAAGDVKHGCVVFVVMENVYYGIFSVHVSGEDRKLRVRPLFRNVQGYVGEG